jgi:hypothetical protein
MNIIDLIIFYEEANHACQTKIMTFPFIVRECKDLPVLV